MTNQPAEYIPKTVWQPIRKDMMQTLFNIASLYDKYLSLSPRLFVFFAGIANMPGEKQNYTTIINEFAHLAPVSRASEFYKKLSNSKLIREYKGSSVVTKAVTNEFVLADVYKTYMSFKIEPPLAFILLCYIAKNDLGFTVGIDAIHQYTKHICAKTTMRKYVDELVSAGYLIKTQDNSFIVDQNKIKQIKV